MAAPDIGDNLVLCAEMRNTYHVRMQVLPMWNDTTPLVSCLVYAPNILLWNTNPIWHTRPQEKSYGRVHGLTRNLTTSPTTRIIESNLEYSQQKYYLRDEDASQVESQSPASSNLSCKQILWMNPLIHRKSIRADWVCCRLLRRLLFFVWLPQHRGDHHYCTQVSFVFLRALPYAPRRFELIKFQYVMLLIAGIQVQIQSRIATDTSP